MNRKMSNSWCLLGLTALLLTACVLLATGTAFARYKESFTADVTLQPQLPSKVLLWAGSDPQTDYVPGAGSWSVVDGQQTMAFLVTNTGTDGQIPAMDQSFRLRLAAGMGAWDGKTALALRLTVTEKDVTHIYYATIHPIEADTPLHREFGDGWYFTFLDDKGKELSFSLEGGARSTIPLELALENAAFTDPALVKLQVIGQQE